MSNSVIFFRRDSLRFRFAHTTVQRAINEVPDYLSGSRIGIVLHEIKSRFGSQPSIGRLVDAALGGSLSKDVFTRLRDHLITTGDPRAEELARQYNWHRVHEGLERDRHLRDFVKAASKGGVHEGTGQEMRRYWNWLEHSPEKVNDDMRKKWYDAMKGYLESKTGTKHSYEQIQDSMRRNGETEHNLEQIRLAPRIGKKSDPTDRGLRSGEHIHVEEYPTSAWTGKKTATPRPRQQIAAGQFKRKK